MKDIKILIGVYQKEQELNLILLNSCLKDMRNMIDKNNGVAPIENDSYRILMATRNKLNASIDVRDEVIKDLSKVISGRI